MDDHAEGQASAKTRAISRLEWPAPDVLAAARRARGLYLRELIVMLARWVKSRVAGHVLDRPARLPTAIRR